MCQIAENSIGTIVSIYQKRRSININGVTRSRLEFDFQVDPSGADFTLNTSNIPSGKHIDLFFLGFVAPYS